MARTAEITFKEFRRRYATEDACRAELFRLRFPNGFVCPKEPLNKSPSAVSGSFPSTLRYRKREIHTVFRRLRYLDWTKNLSLTALADLIRASLVPLLYPTPPPAAIWKNGQELCKLL